jgi:hypothetical protein
MKYNLCLIKYVVLVLIGVSFFILTTEKNTFARPFFNIGTPKLGLGLFYDFSNEKNTGPDVNTRSEIQEFRERLNIETNGWIYHPALWQFELELSPQFTQRKEEFKTFEDSKAGSKNATLQAYYFDTTILPYKPYSLTFFGQRRETPQTSAFSAITDQLSESIGASLILKNRVLPTTLSYTQSTLDKKGFYESTDEYEKWLFKSNNRTKKSTTNLNANYEERTFSTEGTTTSEIESLNSSLYNNFRISGDRGIVLNSFLSHRLTDDTFIESSSINLNESLRWSHRNNLSTSYSFNYGRNETGDNLNETTAYRAGLSHGLYENLTTNVSGNAEKNDFSGGKRKSYGGGLNFNYSRRIPYGSLGLNMGWNYSLRSQDFSEDYIPVLNEGYILTGFDFTLLDNKFIDINSIKVTNVDGTIIYTKDIDYKVQEVNFFVRISRTLGTGIADGERVLVSYRYLSGASYDDSTLSQAYGFSIDLWSMLLLSYQYQHSKQKFLSGIPPDSLQDDTTHTAKLQWLWKFTNTIISYENADRSAGNSNERWRVGEVLTFVPSTQIFLRFNGDFAHDKFTNGIEDTQNALGLGFGIDWLPRSSIKLSLNASHYIQSGASTDREDTAIDAKFEMSYFIWNFSLGYTFLNQNDKIDNETRKVNKIFCDIVKLNF